MTRIWLTSFAAGCVAQFSIVSLYQDCLGKEAYLEMAEQAWKSGSITVPLAIFLLMYAASLIHDARKAEKQIKGII